MGCQEVLSPGAWLVTGDQANEVNVRQGAVSNAARHAAASALFQGVDDVRSRSVCVLLE